MMLRWPKLGLTRPYYKYLWRCWLLVGLVLLQRISYGRMEEILQLRSSGRGSTGGSETQHHQQQQQRQQLEEQELFSSSSSSNEIECPSFAENSACPCYKFEDGTCFSVVDALLFSFFRNHRSMSRTWVFLHGRSYDESKR